MNLKTKWLLWLHERRKERAYRFVQRAYEKSGGPTPELVRVYGAYLEWKRQQAETEKKTSP